MPDNIIPFSFGGVAITKDIDDRISLTDLWKASGKDRSYNPNEWTRQDSTKNLIETAAGILNTVSTRIINTKRGKGGGTFAHKQIALAYAKYLSPELHLTVNQVFFERIEEEKNPELAIDRAISDYQKQGKNESWIEKRLRGKLKRLSFTKVLAEHAVKDKGFSTCTNAIYLPIFGNPADQLRKERNLPDKANTREAMTEIELAQVAFAEELAQHNIRLKQIKGNAACTAECLKAGEAVAGAIKAAQL